MTDREAIRRLAGVLWDHLTEQLPTKNLVNELARIMDAEPAAPNQTEQLKKGISDLCDLLDDVLGYVPGEDEDEWGFTDQFREIKKRLKEAE